MLTFTKKYSRNYYSQNGEDGIIEECIKRIHVSGAKDFNSGVCVEFGAHDGKYCSNTRRLFEAGWIGRMIEGDSELFKQCCSNMLGYKCNVINDTVTPDNVNKLLPKTIDLLSMDTDGHDYSIWKAYNSKPVIVVIEINSSVMATDDGPVNDPQHGTAYKPMVELGISKGYFLLCHTGNLIFVSTKHKHLFPEVIGTGVDNWQLYFQTKWLTE